MNTINWVFWLGLVSSLLSFIAFVMPKRLKEIGQKLLDDLTLRAAYYDLERVYSLCRTQRGRLFVSGACVCCGGIGAYIIRQSYGFAPMPLLLWGVAIP